MKIISMKLSKLIIICAVVLIGLALIFSTILGISNSDDYSLIKEESGQNSEGSEIIEKSNENEHEKAEEAEKIEFDEIEGLDQEVMEIFPREDYEDWDIEHEEEFFVEYRLQRDRIRSEEIEKLNQLMDNPEISQEAKERAENKLLEILNVMEKEMLIENLIKSYGFEDAILFYRQDSATVAVKAENLSETEVRQIVELVSDKIGLNLDEVKVVENL
ncbi:SpoIIIAH-like family protein [Natranaerofaba carboxydovora]|uniref:SpoIIIAH-like family protein n=1 Tax=Natranaerofaba carboxydovora TaxID=2742683 RepID=UPI001F129B45|nr:SpoIIIAH-like family protein [Natranaerofaba carboxydovora]UMZ73956.1 Stage III sporulation protein AH [Natranaerofaba carboxydovora]